MGFSLTDGRLTITTSTSVIGFEEGAILYVKDLAADEVILNSSTTDIPLNWNPNAELPAFCGIVANDSGLKLLMPSNSATITWTDDDPGVSGWLAYSVLYYNGGPVSGSSITYHFTIDPSGYVIITCDPTLPSGYSDVNAYLPIINFTGQNGVILSNGKQYNYADETIKDNPYSRMPMASVINGTNAVIGLWSEIMDGRSSYDGEIVVIRHTQSSHDHIFLQNSQTDQEFTSGANTGSGGPWGVGSFSTWLDVAKAYRTRYEYRTGAKKLWETDYTWVSDIHSMSIFKNADLATVQAFAATVYDPSKMLSFQWNGGTWDICWWGDPTFTTSPEVQQVHLDNIKNCTDPVGLFKLMCYMPWTMYMTPTQVATRKTNLQNQGVLPIGHQDFVPIWDGATLDDWNAQWAIWGDAIGFYQLLYPGATEFFNYINVNYPYYANLHNCDAFFIDTSGTTIKTLMNQNGPLWYLSNSNNYSYAEGEAATIASLLNTQPSIALMSEYLCVDLKVPFCYTSNYRTDLDHPFLTALMGSYTWAYEIGVVSWSVYTNDASLYPLKQYALYSGIPMHYYTGQISSADVIDTSQARVKLFNKREMYNDLPTVWKNYNPDSYPNTVGYYKSNTDNMVRLEERTSNVFAYVEEHPNGDYDRLVIDDGVVTLDNIDEILPGVRSYSRYHYMTLPADDADLTTLYTVQDLLDVRDDDGTRVGESGTGYILHEFKEVAGPYDTKVDLHCNLQAPLAPADYPVYLQCYDRVTVGGMWVTVVTNNSAAANTDFDMDFQLNSGTTPTFANCKDEDGTVSSRVYQTNVPLS